MKTILPAVVAVVVVLAVAGFWALRTQSVKQQQCLNSLRQLDSAVIQYCLEQRLSPTNVLSVAAVAHYLKPDMRCPSGPSDYAPFTVFNGPVCPNGHPYEPGVPRPRRATYGEHDLLGILYKEFGFTNLLDRVAEPNRLSQ
jgi:hypothetical protein